MEAILRPQPPKAHCPGHSFRPAQTACTCPNHSRRCGQQPLGYEPEQPGSRRLQLPEPCLRGIHPHVMNRDGPVISQPASCDGSGRNSRSFRPPYIFPVDRYGGRLALTTRHEQRHGMEFCHTSMPNAPCCRRNWSSTPGVD